MILINWVIILDQAYIGNNKKINIEFISANPTGPLHIAHSRGAVFGDVLSNLIRKSWI